MKPMAYTISQPSSSAISIWRPSHRSVHVSSSS